MRRSAPLIAPSLEGYNKSLEINIDSNWPTLSVQSTLAFKLRNTRERQHTAAGLVQCSLHCTRVCKRVRYLLATVRPGPLDILRAVVVLPLARTELADLSWPPPLELTASK
jgi:hypothetical protein